MATIYAYCLTYRQACELSNDLADIDDERFTHGLRERTITIECEDGIAERWVRQLESDNRVDVVQVG